MRQRSKTTLFLMELVLMILFFAISAAICMRVFSVAQLKSKASNEISNASLKAQSAAECWKLSQGNADFLVETLSAVKTENGVVLYMDSSWKNCDKNEALFILEMTEDGDYAQIDVAHLGDDGVKYKESIFTLTVKAVPNGK